MYKALYRKVKSSKTFPYLAKRKGVFTKQNKRKYAVAVAGGALGDEGKGRITDELTSYFLEKKKKVIHYRDNGGSNAGHTVKVKGATLALHQIGAGVLQKGCIVVIGKNMVIHPEDLVSELEQVKMISKDKKIPAQIVIDEMTPLCLDTHRAFESALKIREKGGRGSTGRGIAPAYADVIYRHPVRFRDLIQKDMKKTLSRHYKLYKDLLKGLGFEIKKMNVPRLSNENIIVGTFPIFLSRIKKALSIIAPFVQSAHTLVQKEWKNNTPFVFEKAQALGLDSRWGVYPDVTSSNCSFDGIFSSTEGVVDPDTIPVRAIAIKATYTSSVGSRILPTKMNKALAHRIREDAHEYGASTGRPRGIVHIDLPMLSFLRNVGKATHLVLTHLDICYPDTPIKVCIAYKRNGKVVPYRPDQEYLLGVTPEYIECEPWDGKKIQNADTINDLPASAKRYCAFIAKALNLPILMITVGPERYQTIRLFK